MVTKDEDGKENEVFFFCCARIEQRLTGGAGNFPLPVWAVAAAVAVTHVPLGSESCPDGMMGVSRCLGWAIIWAEGTFSKEAPTTPRIFGSTSPTFFLWKLP